MREKRGGSQEKSFRVSAELPERKTSTSGGGRPMSVLGKCGGRWRKAEFGKLIAY